MAAHEIADCEIDGVPGVALESRDAGLRVRAMPSLAMLVASVAHRGEELLGRRKGVAAYAATGSTMGIPLLYPWANRISSLDIRAAGRGARIDPGSPLVRTDEHGLPIHGLRTAGRGWRVIARTADDDEAVVAATFDAAADPEVMALFPFPHAITVRLTLSGERITVDVDVTAGADSPVPVAFGFHPYLRLPGVPRADWAVELPVRRHALLDERGIPTGRTEEVSPVATALGARVYDDLYPELVAPRRFSLAGGGRRIEVRLGAGFPVAQVFAPASDDVVCFEPMTAPTDALVTGGPRLPVVAPGEAFAARFTLSVLPGGPSAGSSPDDA
jgi:galactose mutarotase-like enzyme